MRGDLGCILSVVSKMLPASHGVRVVIHTQITTDPSFSPRNRIRCDSLYYVLAKSLQEQEQK